MQMALLMATASLAFALAAPAAVPGRSMQRMPQPRPSVPQTPPPPPVPLAASVDVIITTTQGPIQVQLDGAHAPLTSANFLAYVDARRFDGSSFYRAMKIGDEGEYGLVQGGLRGDPRRIYKAVAHEASSVTGLSHVDGTISMARAEPGSATADFFIVVGNLTTLDASASDPGYAVFGKVTSGMDVVRRMLELPRSDTAPVEAMKGQMLAEPVKILSVRRAPPAPAATPPTTPAP